MTLEQIQEAYSQLCTRLGDIEVKLDGLQQIKRETFREIQALDLLASKAKERENEDTK